MKTINLTQGKVAKVDDKDYKHLNQWKWCAHRQPNGRFYAVRTVHTGPGRSKSVRMHREIMKAAQGQLIDHADRDGLNNRRRNLRFCTQGQNSMNSQKTTKSKCSSKYKGVYWDKGSEKWRARLRIDGKCISLGMYYFEVKAAMAYDMEAIERFGKFARPNFP